MSDQPIGILAAATLLPPRTKTLREIFDEEGVPFTEEAASRLGVEQVHIFEGESPTDMAVEVSKDALAKGSLSPLDLDAIIDFSVMPQKYVEPAWSMSNELQAELGAKKAFTLGYSGGGCSNLHVALKFATSLIRADDEIRTILLVASDCAIPGNRLIDRKNPVTAIGDGASALIIQRDAPGSAIIDTMVSTEGGLHDVINIPGGGIAHPARLDLYRLVLDRAKYDAFDRVGGLKKLTAALLDKHALEQRDIGHFITPNISGDDIDAFIDHMGSQDHIARQNLSSCGHLHSNDLVMNYLSARQNGARAGDLVMLASHGMGFTTAATLLRL